MLSAFKYPTTLSLCALLFSSLASSQKGCLFRDDACKAKTWNEEYGCLMKSNSLRTIMDCVEIKEQPGADLEYSICRPLDNGIDDDLEQYYYTSASKKGQWCTKPRTILIKGPLTYKNGWKLSIMGALEACPEADPDFHNCLCMQNVKIEAMNALAQYFKKVTSQDLECPKKLPKRSTSFLDEMAETPHLNQARDNATDFHRHTLHPRALAEFTIDRWGRPVYADGRGTGYPLPYYDQYISNQAARRCYIHPEVNVEASCRTWRLATPVTLALSQRPIKAVYAQQFTPTAVQSTLSAQPDTTSIVAEQLVEASASSSGGSSTPTPTGAAGTGSARRAQGDVGVLLHVVVMMVAGVFLAL
ncbi:hypothetical protein CC86DRAFT_371843 [Ophiobolus disseminans]|uniref:Extracellular membrane protein CFEM domain-containing protein n=1 Tax=Ophiobolus disseminans TaxID=1469910 RepID=A0A6A6ZW37_9PLEO|nr:hypothetical protein CC86DRAFT_371843 [Ophiobolus disseminans]